VSNHDLNYWVARCRAGEEIPHQKIVAYALTRWFLFTPIKGKQDASLALAEADGRRVDFTTGEMVSDPDYVPPPSGAAS
jgi:hypothetical protein